MPDRPQNGDDDQYGWLSQRKDRPSGDGPNAGQGYDPDATQVVPRTAPADDASVDRTQLLRVPPPAAAAASSRGAATSSARPSSSQPPPMPMPAPSGGGSGGSGTPPTATKSQSPRSRAKIVRRVILALVLVWVVFLVAVPIWAWSKIDKVDATPDGDRPADQPGTTYLLVGSDSRAGLSKQQEAQLHTGDAAGQRTDTIMLLHVGDGQPLLLSIPRDSEVPIPGHGTNKINAAFSYGGPQLLVQTIEQNTGIYVDDYVEIGFGGFADVVDAVGGINVCTDQAINHDPKTHLTMTKGCHDVDGQTALDFARTRYSFADSDLTRVQNQRQVLGKIGSKAVGPWTILNPFRYASIANAGASSLTIGDNVGPIALARFAWALAHVTSGSGQTCTMPITDGSATQWDPSRSKQMFSLFIDDHTDDVTNSICTPTGLPPQ